MNKFFIKVPKGPEEKAGKGGYWQIDPQYTKYTKPPEVLPTPPTQKNVKPPFTKRKFAKNKVKMNFYQDKVVQSSRDRVFHGPIMPISGR